MLDAMRLDKQMENGLDIELLVGRYYDQINHLALSILDDPDAAADAAQDTFVAASQKLDTFRHEADVRTWLFAIAINTCRSVLRKRQARQRLQRTWQAIQTVFQRDSAVETVVQQDQQNRALWQTVDNLHERHRLPVILHYLHGFSAAEIAATLSISEGTVHSRLFYARRQLKSLLQEQPHDTL